MKSMKTVILRIVLIVLILEVAVFNFRFWESLFFKDNIDNNYVLGSGLEKIEENDYKVIDSTEAYFEIDNVNREIKNICINAEIIGGTGETRYLPMSISATDEGNALYREFSQVNVVNYIKESQYYRLYLSGESKAIKVTLKVAEGTVVRLNEINLNCLRPFCIHPVRMMFLVILFVLCYLFRTKSRIYEMELNFSQMRQKVGILMALILNILVLLVVSVAILPKSTWASSTWPADIEYEKLTDALLDGHFYLNEEPSETLKKMDNPYDPLLRDKLHNESGETYLIDYAYYNGKYYCYFGIVPALLFFVPFKAIFGIHLPTWIMVTFCGLAYCVVSYVFVYSLIKKYYSKISLGMYLVCTTVFIAMSAVVYLLFLATVYSVPIILGILLGITGLTFWLNAETEGLNKTYLVLGSICIALIIGCRPQLAVVLLLAFPIFGDAIKKGDFFSRKGFANTMCVIIPFLIVGCGVMYYNYARFGSVFDFGANYNLTGNDMTHRGIVLARNWLGIFEYLFQPLNVSSRFPYIKTIGNNLQIDYQGIVSYEPLFGGFLWFNPIVVLSMLALKHKDELKIYKIRGLAIGALGSAFVLILVTIQMSGLTQRYMSDFGWLVGIGTILLLLFMYEHLHMDKKLFALFMKTLVCLSTITVFLNYFNIFILERYGSMVAANPISLYWVKYVLFTI